MKIKKYFIVSFLTLLACGCQEEELTTAQPTPGADVKFGATLNQNNTRTIYGEEGNKGFPIYWVNGDQVLVSSPECGRSSGYGSATYQVSVEGAEQNYANSLDKTGDIGVRWGDNPTADFYSIYPASRATLNSSDYTMTLNMASSQDINIDAQGIARSDMDACFMYAKTAGVSSGSTVNLRYVPLSTAIRFSLQGPTSSESVSIRTIELRAPANVSIAGKFKVDFTNADENTLPTTTAIDGENVIYLSPATSTGGYLTLRQGDKVELNAFLMLTGETEITEQWSIVVTTTNGTVYTKNLGSLPNGNTTLKPGMIHRLPDLPTMDETKEWNVSSWMTNIPRNVYLSEISIPGSWNSLNSDFQGTNPSITAQYNAGARAFHIDTRWNAKGLTALGGIGDLGVAGGGTSINYFGDGRIMPLTNQTFESALNEITGRVEGDEYMVVLVTFAQDSYDYNRSNGGWEQEVSNICAENSDVIDARTLNANTVVGDVLGKVIVIVNTDNAVSSADSKCLFMRGMGMTLVQNTYRSTDYTETTLADGSGTTRFNAYGTHAQVSATSNGLGYGSSDRGYAPSLPERETKAGNILKWSKSNYSDVDNYAHDTWLYIGLGGYQVNEGGDRAITGSYNTVASTLNSWINTQVTNMDTDGYYPVGIVLMNFVTNTSYRAVMNNILQLNNKYRMAYDPDRSPIDGSQITGSGSNNVQSAAPGYSSGMTDNKTNAIHW